MSDTREQAEGVLATVLQKLLDELPREPGTPVACALVLMVDAGPHGDQQAVGQHGAVVIARGAQPEAMARGLLAWFATQYTRIADAAEQAPGMPMGQGGRA